MKKLTANLFVSILFICTNTYATNYYFSSSSGDDSRSSTQAQSSSTPWKTLSKLNSFFSSLQPGDHIYFKRGDIFYGSISPTKSGTSSGLIYFDAYGTGAKPTISGLSDATGWTNLGSNIWESSAISAGQTTAMTVLIGGISYPMGRWPNATDIWGGFRKIGSHSGSTSITDASALPSSPNWTGATVVMRKNQYVMEKGTVTSQSGNSLSYSTTWNKYGVSDGYGYFIENSKSTLDKQNEWYYNSSTKKLDIYSLSTPSNVKISTVGTLINLNSRSYFSFNNLSIQGSIGRMIVVTSSSNITITNCDLYGAGSDAIYGSNNSYLDVENCTINNSNHTAITLEAGASNTIIRNNIISGSGANPGMLDSYWLSGAVYIAGSNTTIEKNSVSNSGYAAINFGMGNNISIKNNFVDTYEFVLDEAGGIYTWRGPDTKIYTNRTVDGNIVINGVGALNGKPGTKGAAAGIQMDNNTQNVSIINNSVSKIAMFGILLLDAHEITISNNTVYDCVSGAFGLMHGAANNLVRNVNLKNNRFVQKITTNDLGNWSYQGLSDILQFGASDSNIIATPLNDANAFVTYDGSTYRHQTLSQWQSFSGKDLHSKKSPKTITNVADLRFEYNATSSNKVVNIGASYMDVAGKNFVGSITLAPYTSAVLIYQSGVIANQAPVANAGNPLSINLPVNLVQLNGSASSDAGGTITAYSWSKISGPSSPIILTPSLVSTTVNTLVQGVYQFELKVTDNQGAVGKDTVQVTVNAVANVAPVANAGVDRDITIPAFKRNSPIILSLTGTGTDNDGTIASYKWSKISGPVCTIDNPNQAQTMITDLTYGVYVFELAVTDNQNAIGKDRVQITLDTAVSPSKNKAEIADENEMIARSSFLIYPNPVRDNFTLSINNSHTGKMNIQIVNQAGMIVRRFILNKDQQTNSVNLPAGDLPVGVYFIHVQIGNWSDKRTILKL